MGFEFAHFNFNVTSLENSKKFYEEALGLKEIHRMTGNGFTLVYLGAAIGLLIGIAGIFI